MSDLTEFLLARITEDEETAAACMPSVGGDLLALRFDTARVLAECDAKRRIVELAAVTERSATALDEQHGLDDWSPVAVLRDAIRLLALPYAGHPDFREEWRA